jgi:type IV pilus assembly protein PilW
MAHSVKTRPVRGRPGAAPTGQRGLTLVELLVAATLGLLLIGGILYTYLGSRGAFRSTKSTARVQEAGRFGLDALARDVRQAGFVGCGSRESLANFQPPTILQLATPALSFTNPGQAVFEPWPISSWTPPTTITSGSLSSDVLIVHTSYGTAALPMVQPPDFTKPAIYLANNCGGQIKMDHYLMLASCSMATVLRVSNTPDASSAACPASGVVASGVEVDYATTDSNGNTINVYPGGTPTLRTQIAGSTAPAGPTLGSRPGVQVFDEITYFVAKLPNRPWSALYRYPLSNGTIANGGLGPEEVIDHVDDMCVLYGVRGSTGAVTEETASSVTSSSAWNSVVHVRVSLLATGDEDGVVDTANQPTYPWCGSTKTPGDRHYHQVFTSTIALRDVLP